MSVDTPADEFGCSGDRPAGLAGSALAEGINVSGPRYDGAVSKLVPIMTPLTEEVAVFVSTLQSKGSAVSRVDDPQVFRQAVRVEARRRGQRVRTGVTDRDPHVVWACDPSSTLPDEEYAKADRRAANLLGALIYGSGVTMGSRIPRNTPD